MNQSIDIYCLWLWGPLSQDYSLSQMDLFQGVWSNLSGVSLVPLSVKIELFKYVPVYNFWIPGARADVNSQLIKPDPIHMLPKSCGKSETQHFRAAPRNLRG